MTKKTAVILLNLGGPDQLSSVRGFLFNLFYDPAIISLPNPFRWLLAKFISTKREKTAKHIYSQIGNRSPILEISKKQALSLEKQLGDEFKVFVSMRYWHPFAAEIIEELEKFSFNEIILLPLYPQYSTTTTQSSLNEFKKLLAKSSLKDVSVKSICCYFDNPNFIKAQVDLIKQSIKDLKHGFRILFSAHGLPEYVIRAGDPYQWQIEQTVGKIMLELNSSSLANYVVAPTGDLMSNVTSDLDYKICYQSKVGSLKWIGPSTEDELLRAAEENLGVVVVPIAFVSDHSETLVELDIEYKDLFKERSDKAYIRVPALNENKDFILSLVDQVNFALKDQERKICPKEFCKCWNN